MAAVALVGGDDNARWSRGKEAEEGRVLEGERGEVQAVEGKCVALGDDSSNSGNQELTERARTPRPHALLPTGRRLGVTGAWASWAGCPLGRPGKSR